MTEQTINQTIKNKIFNSEQVSEEFQKHKIFLIIKDNACLSLEDDFLELFSLNPSIIHH